MAVTMKKDRNTNKKKDNSNNTLPNLENCFRKCELFEKSGWYKGVFKGFKDSDSYIMASTETYSLDGSKCYGTVNGFLPRDYAKGDLTDRFIQSVGNISDFSLAIGMEVKVFLDFNESATGNTYVNIFDFDTL